MCPHRLFSLDPRPLGGLVVVPIGLWCPVRLPRYFPIGPGLLAVRQWVVFCPTLSPSGLVSQSCSAPGLGGECNNVISFNTTDMLIYSRYLCPMLAYYLYMYPMHVHYITLTFHLHHGFTLGTWQHHSLVASPLYGWWNPPSTRVSGLLVGARHGGSLVKGVSITSITSTTSDSTLPSNLTMQGSSHEQETWSPRRRQPPQAPGGAPPPSTSEPDPLPGAPSAESSDPLQLSRFAGNSQSPAVSVSSRGRQPLRGAPRSPASQTPSASHRALRRPISPVSLPQRTSEPSWESSSTSASSPSLPSSDSSSSRP